MPSEEEDMGWKYTDQSSPKNIKRQGSEMVSIKSTDAAMHVNAKGAEVFTQFSQRIHVEGASQYVGDIPSRFHSPALLLSGTITCGANFLVVSIVAFSHYIDFPTNLTLNRTFESGNGYFPASMGEMVHNQDSPGGKIFHTFGMMGALLIIMSWYPVHLRNVYTRRAEFLGIYWSTWRQVVPAMGLLLLNGVNTYPYSIAIYSPGYTKMLCVVLHWLGSLMVFAGYACCECVCLGITVQFWKSPGPQSSFAFLKHKEWWWRAGLMWVTVIAGFTHLVIMVVLDMPGSGVDFLCCADEWKLPGENVTIEGDGRFRDHLITRPQIWNTAEGIYLGLKVTSFLLEDLATLCIAMSQFVIWHWCDERRFNFFEDWTLAAITDVEFYDVKD